MVASTAPPPSSSIAPVVDAALRGVGGCASQCDPSAIVHLLVELGATDEEDLRVLLLHCPAELTARLSSVARLRVN